MELAFYLFLEHHILPSQFYGMLWGEQLIVRAFFMKAMELRKEARGRI